MIDVPSLVGGWGSNWRTHRAQQQRPPSPALPHKGGGSRPSLPRELIPLIGIRTERAPDEDDARCGPAASDPAGARRTQASAAAEFAIIAALCLWALILRLPFFFPDTIDC